MMARKYNDVVHGIGTWRGHSVNIVTVFAGSATDGVKLGDYYTDFELMSFGHWIREYKNGNVTLPYLQEILRMDKLDRFLLPVDTMPDASTYERMKKTEDWERMWLDVMSQKEKNPEAAFAKLATVSKQIFKTLEAKQ